MANETLSARRKKQAFCVLTFTSDRTSYGVLFIQH